MGEASPEEGGSKKELRLVTAEVEVKRKMTGMEFITNNFDWSPFTVCELYRARWGIEVFFKEIPRSPSELLRPVKRYSIL